MALRIRERASLIRKRSAGARLLAVAALSVALAMPGIAQDKAGPGTRSTEESNNAYRAGASVSLTEPITGDFYAAGGRVRVDQPVARDAVIVGGDVSVNATVGEDLRAAAGHVTLDGKVRGEAILAGGNVTLASGSDIGGRATLAGGELMIDGRIGKDVRAYAGRISVRGVIDGDARFVAREIELLPGSRVNGTLTYTSREDIRIDPKAFVVGKVIHEVAPKVHRGRRMEGPSRALSIVWLLGLVVAGSVYLLLLPNFTRATRDTLGTSPWKSLGIGIATLFAGPPLVLLLLLTIIGIPLAFALLAAYALLMLAAYLTTAIFIGDRGARLLRTDADSSATWRIAALAAALVLLALLHLVPFLGTLVMVLALTFGAGALILQAFKRYTGTHA